MKNKPIGSTNFPSFLQSCSERFPSFSSKEGSGMARARQGWFIILIIIFILSTFIYIGIQHRKINRLSDANQLQAVQLSTLQDSVSVFKSKTGELTYRLSSVAIEKDNLKRSLEFAGFDIKELRERDIKWRKVTAALRAQLSATGHVETDIKPDTFRISNTDTIYFQKVSDWSNNYLSIYNGEIVQKKLSFDYSYRTGISILQTQNRSATIVSVALTDPNAAIVSGNSITIKHKKRIWERGCLWAAIGLTGGILIAK